MNKILWCRKELACLHLVAMTYLAGVGCIAYTPSMQTSAYDDILD